MRALVLTGGSIKGAFQAGALADVLDRGFVPDVIYGISVGALNGTFLADRAGRQATDGAPPRWPELGAELEAFWRRRVTRPADLVRERPATALGLALLTRRFDGLVDTRPLRELVRGEVSMPRIRAAPVHLQVGAVNMRTGAIVYAGPDRTAFLDYVLASTAIPVVMPLVDAPDGADGAVRAPFYDGGLRDIAPVGHAINEGATKVLVIACQSAEADPVDFARGDLMRVMERVMSVVTSEILDNDLRMLEQVNRLVEEFGTGGVLVTKERSWRRIEARIVRPAKGALTADLRSFTRADVDEMLRKGRAAAAAQVEDAFLRP